MYINRSPCVVERIGRWPQSVKDTDIAVHNRNHDAVTGNHTPQGITQCYLPPDSGDFPALITPAEAGTRFSDPGGMEG